METLSIEQEFAYNKFVNGENLFITGPGGTGKTRLVQHLIKHAIAANKHIPVCAMTGCAALLLNCNARTLHSWSGIKLAKGTNAQVVASVLRNKRATATWKRATGLILDEVSMLSKKIFEIIEEIARTVRRSELPFGGMQIVLTGDFYQLPPIGSDSEPDTEKFCFESPVWNRVFKPENHIQLTTMFRQLDREYIDILLQIRKGEITEEQRQVLLTCVNRTYDPTINNECVPTKLYPLRTQADYINNNMFSKLKGKEYVFEMQKRSDCNTNLESTKPLSSDVLTKCTKMSAMEKEYEFNQLINNTRCMQILRLKKGAAVMCTVNLDMDNAICNGSQGIVIDMIETGTFVQPVVKFSNGIIKTLQPRFWQSEDFPTLAIGQYPLCLAWALTIHKIQGATLSMAEMDLGRSIFEYGQTYVALSRVKALGGLYLSAFHADKIRANPIVTLFYNSLPAIDMTLQPKSNIASLDASSSNPLSFDKYAYAESSTSKIVRL